MPLNIKAPENVILKPIITVFGVGGGGGNAVTNMINAGLGGANFVIANTDAQALSESPCEHRIQLGAKSTKGLGAGALSDTGKTAAEESESEIKARLENSNMVFVTAGMGGGTGTGAAPVIARFARELGILTVGVVTKPFLFEGARRMEQAEKGLIELQKHVDTLIVIPNQNLFRIANENTTFEDAFKMADDVLHAGVRGVTDLITIPGLINLDFADIKTVMNEMGKAMMGTGEGEGEDRAIKAAEAAISNPLLDHSSMCGARSVLINITGGKDMKLYEVDSAANRIREEVGDPDANIIFGSAFDEKLEGIIRVSVVATGMDADKTNVQEASKEINVDTFDQDLGGINSENLVGNDDEIEDIDEHIPPSFDEYEDKLDIQNESSEKMHDTANDMKWNVEPQMNNMGSEQNSQGSAYTSNNKNLEPKNLDYENVSQKKEAKPSFLKRIWNALKAAEGETAQYQSSKQKLNQSIIAQESDNLQHQNIQDRPSFGKRK